MKPVKKQFLSDLRFPFNFVYQDTKSRQSELPDHVHDWHELVYVYRGMGTFFIDQAFYDMEAGDLFVIPGNTIHRAFPDSVDPVTSTAVFFGTMLVPESPLGDSFSYLHGIEHAKKAKVYKIQLAEDERPLIEGCLESIHQELLCCDRGFRHAVVIELSRILLQLNRGMPAEPAAEIIQSAVGADWMKEILPYIDGHLQEDVSLSALARRASVTSSHFSRVFKQMTGMTVTEYVNTKKMLRAGELLDSTDDSIATVADRIGMESLPHFHRIFKKVMGTTPAAYKRRGLPRT